MARSRKIFSEEVKQKAVDEFISGLKSAEQIAAELGASASHVYKWRTRFDELKKGIETSELEAQGSRPEDIKKIRDLEKELNEYKLQLAEKTVIAELLKKRLQSKSSQQRSELTGLIETFELAVQKRKHGK